MGKFKELIRGRAKPKVVATSGGTPTLNLPSTPSTTSLLASTTVPTLSTTKLPASGTIVPLPTKDPPPSTLAIPNFSIPLSLSEVLWRHAYEKLRGKEPDLVQSFEEVSGATFTSQDNISSIVKARLDRRDERQWVITIAGKPVKVREIGERLIKFTLWSKDLVTDALSSQPYMALAWSGMTLILSMALTPSQESDAMVQGFELVASLLRLYDIRTKQRNGSPQDEYLGAVIELYACILEFQAHLSCHLSHNTMIRGFHSVTQPGQWASLMQKIDNADQYCQKAETLLDKEAERQQWNQQTKEIERSRKVQESVLIALREYLTVHTADRRDVREREILHCLAGDWIGQKNFNPQRAADTCRWFLDDTRFQQWRGSKESCLLWLSTGPGCGKSVLSRALIDDMLLTSNMMTSTVCYFIFKDGLERRRRGEDALCAILHQLYSQNLAFGLVSHALLPYKTNGQSLNSMFFPLWDLLMTTAKDPAAGEVICLLDGLDECDAETRQELLDVLALFCDGSTFRDPDGPRVKFLITSRPNYEIDMKFSTLERTGNYIKFDGDNATHLISQEINLVIDQRLREVCPKLDTQSLSIIAKHLKSMQHRTYLWLYLILQEVRDKFTSHATVKRIKALTSQLPTSVTQAYENILNRSSDKQVARSILQIVLAAGRPLTVDEMTVAIAITRTNTTVHRSI